MISCLESERWLDEGASLRADHYSPQIFFRILVALFAAGFVTFRHRVALAFQNVLTFQNLLRW